jgi:hypothetical protein
MISVIMPSRKRPVSLQRGIRTLFDMASNREQVEVLVACDPDDEATQAVHVLGVRIFTMPERYGYTGFHTYLWAVSQHATGEWLMNWDDQAEMLTPGWDTTVHAQAPAVLWPAANHCEGGNIMPVWPKAWTDAMGYVAPYNHIDTYLQRLGERLGRHVRVPFSVLHNRADVTGIPEDDTYREGRKILGPYGMSGPLPEEALARDYSIIMHLLAETAPVPGG